MSSSQNITGQVLGASTAVVAGVAILPDTGGSLLSLLLPVTAIACGSIILFSLLVTRIVKKFT